MKHRRTNKDKPWPLMGDVRTEIITCITKEEWLAGSIKKTN
jgi:ribosomal-protein-alanine N-acetyltransferase